MGTYTNEILHTDTVIAAGAITLNRFVKFGGLQAGAGDAVHGVAAYSAAIGEALAINVAGNLSVEAGAAIDAHARVKSDAQGRAVPAAADDDAAGIALKAAIGAGQPVRILRLSVKC